MKFTTTMVVEAWQYEGDGILDHDAIAVLAPFEAVHVVRQVDYHTRLNAAHTRMPFPKDMDRADFIHWWDCGGYQRVFPNDWVVRTPYGVVAVKEADFEATYQRVSDDTPLITYATDLLITRERGREITDRRFGRPLGAKSKPKSPETLPDDDEMPG